MIFNIIARITPSEAVYGRVRCITFHYLQFGRALGIPFTTTNTSSMDNKRTCRVYPFFKCLDLDLDLDADAQLCYILTICENCKIVN
jgi:hypothetical protein